MSEEVIGNLAKEMISQACQRGAYVYIRGMDGGLIEPDGKGYVYWKVTCEYERGGQWHQLRGEGYELDPAVRAATGEMPANGGHSKPKRKIRIGKPSSGTTKRVVRVRRSR